MFLSQVAAFKNKFDGHAREKADKLNNRLREMDSLFPFAKYSVACAFKKEKNKREVLFNRGRW